LPILSKHLKGYIPDGRRLWIACSKFPGGIDQFKEVKVIHIGTVRNRRKNVWDNQTGATTVNKFQCQARRTYLVNLRRKDQVHHGTAEGGRGPLEAILWQLNFKALVFGTFGEMSSNMGELVETEIEYGVENIGRNMAATTVETVRVALRRRYKAQLSMAAWRGYANLLLERTKYVRMGQAAPNGAQIRYAMRDRGDTGEHATLWMAHETDIPSRDAFHQDGGTIGGML
jgi:hypothetical protein